MNQRILMPFIPMWFPLPSHFKFNRSIGEINERIKALIVLAGQNDSRPSLFRCWQIQNQYRMKPLGMRC